MPAQLVTDLLFEAKPRWSGAIGSGGVAAAGTTTIPLASAANLDNGDAYIFVVNRVTSAGVKNELSEMETAIGELSGTNFINCVRGLEGTAQAWDAGTVVEILFTATHWNKLIQAWEVEHEQDGTHGAITATTITTTGAVNAKTFKIDGGTAMTAIKDEDDMATNSATALATQQSIKAYVDTYGHSSSFYRQAIINGNFDVWQRGTSVALTTANGYTTDRWYVETATAGTDKTVSREDGTGVNGSYYCARVKMVSDVDELLTFSQALESQDSIKFRGQKVTLSFYARGGAEFVADNATLVSKIVTGKGTDQKVLAFTTSADGVSQNNTLTTSWVKFTCTTSAVIASDITQIGVSFAFTHAGSGTTTNYFEVTQVQLCAGSVAIPFQPKSFEEELRACQRYYYKKSANATYTSARLSMGQCYSSSQAVIFTEFPVTMRTIPTPSAGGNLGLNQPNTTISAATFNVIVDATTYNCNVAYQGASGLTAGHATQLSANADATAYIAFDAELC